MLKCDKCGSSKVLLEGVDENCTRLTCQECGKSEVRDQRGAKQLLGESDSSGQVLTETMPLGG